MASGPVTLLDRNGGPLMSNQTVEVISVDPSKVTDKAGTAATMAKVLQPIDSSFTTASVQEQLSGTAPFTLVSLRTTTAADAIRTLKALPGVTSAAQPRFVIDNPELESPVFTQLTAAVNDGTALGSGRVRTSIDSGIQLAAQKALQDSKYPAAIVAIQPSTGGILAVAQNAKANELGPIALNGLYPPGSTFKTVTVAAALADGDVTAQTPLACPATANLEGRLIPNENKFALGTVPLTTAFARSCNTTIAGLGVKLPPEAMSDTAKQFGLGVDYNIPGITTVTGKVPVAKTSFERVEEAIGQWQVVASPFGMALTGATVAAGKLPTPTLVSGTKTVADQQPPAVSSSVISQLQTMFKATVSDGTAEALADIGGVGGKTGTAQYGDGSTSHGWFVGTQKDMAFAVLLVGGEASKNAVSTAGDFLRGAQQYVPGS
ncbi:penicillin-binding transpeptidase domain-containing protein [Nakamurella aerolata]|uniref:Penicillin-binding protein n=1 Tax=Nakamurella aerolata TaxID=1656892 RepID=A0A849AAK1_9ACTN|nr:penicillin-binding protein [Nakamurella aerolata]